MDEIIDQFRPIENIETNSGVDSLKFDEKIPT